MAEGGCDGKAQFACRILGTSHSCWEDRQYQQTHYTSALHRTSLNGSYKGRGFHAYSKTVNVSFEPTINFMRVFADDHTVSAVAGYSYWENNSEDFNMTNYDFLWME